MLSPSIQEPLLEFGQRHKQDKRKRKPRSHSLSEIDIPSDDDFEERVCGRSVFGLRAVKLRPLNSMVQLEDPEKICVMEANLPKRSISQLSELPALIESRQPGASTPVWIDIEANDNTLDRVMLQLQNIFQLHPSTFRDVTCDKTLDKLELFQRVENFADYMLLLIFFPDQRPGYDEFTNTIPLTILLLKGIIITVHVSPLRAIDTVANQFYSGALPSEGHVVASLGMEIVGMFEGLMDNVTEDVDAMEDITLLLSRKELMPLLNRMSVVRKRIAGLLKVLY